MFNGLNNENYLNVAAVTNVFTKEDIERKHNLKNKGVDIKHLEEDVKIEEEYLTHLLHHQQE